MRRRPVLLLATLVACGEASPPTDPDSPPISPPAAAGLEVVYSAPADGAVGVARAATVTLGFSAPVAPSTVHEQTVGLWLGAQPVPVSRSVNGATVSLAPRSLLDLNLTYIVTVSRGVRDTTGTPMRREYRAVFTTKQNLVP